MGAISAIHPPAEIKQQNSIAVKQSSLEVCKNRKHMPFKDLLSSITKKLMSYALMLTSNNEDDAWDLIQSTIEKLIKNKETLQASNQPVAYAKRILKNNFIDKQVCNKPYLQVRDGKCVLKPKPEFAVNCHFKKSGLRQKKVVINNECKRRRYLKKELNLCGSGLKYDYKTKSCVPDFKVYCKGATTYDRKNKQCVF